MPNVLVTDGWCRHSVPAVRSLAKAGYAVHVASEIRRATAFYSRSAAARSIHPPAGPDPAPFAAWLRSYVREHSIEAVLPLIDDTTAALVHDGPPCASLLPSEDSFGVFADKWRTILLARSVGVPVPPSLQAEADPAVAERQASDLGFPIVIKPRRSNAGHGMELVSSPDQFASALMRARTVDPRPVLQRWIGLGRQLDVCQLWDARGQIVATFVQEELRHYPVNFGTSVVSESVPPLDPLVDATFRLVAAAGWRGPVEAEFRQDATGAFQLMEVNPRFWGSLALAVFAGIDFPSLAVDLALGKAVAPPAGYRVGVRTRNLVRNVQYLLSPPARTDPALRIGGNRRTKDDLFEWKDPGPFLRFAGAAVAATVRNGVGPARARLVPAPSIHRPEPRAVENAEAGDLR